MNPVGEGCRDSQICVSDCRCYDSLDNLGDLVILVEHMIRCFISEPKERPDLFKYGSCNQHYHFEKFAEYTLLHSDGLSIALKGQKTAYFCMDDTVHSFDVSTISCDEKFECGFKVFKKAGSTRINGTSTALGSI